MNFIYINPTEFKNLKTGEITTGILIGDDYVSLYVYLENMPDDNVELVKMVINYMMSRTNIITNHIWDMLHEVVEYEVDLNIGYSVVDWDVVVELMKKLPAKKPVYGWLNRIIKNVDRKSNC